MAGWRHDREPRVIIGIGADVVSVPRFSASLARTPGLRDRLFTSREQVTDDGGPRTDTSLAGRFAAKEAVAKALGAPLGMLWHDCEIVSETDGRPRLRLTGTVAAAAEAQHIVHWHLSLSHDGDLAVAYVVAESSS
jgi:holo-[acyl-carrier protein] synthase